MRFGTVTYLSLLALNGARTGGLSSGCGPGGAKLRRAANGLERGAPA